MPSQLRIYKIKPGQMENWLQFFREKVVPLHRKFGIPARIAWINPAESEFVWVRDFSDKEPVEDQERRYVSSEERLRVIGDQSKSFIDSMAVKTMQLVHEET